MKNTIAGLVLALSVAAVAGAAPSGPLSTYLVEPCRFLDTRDDVLLRGESVGPLGEGIHPYILQGACGVPAGAQGVILNVTATEATVAGHLTLVAVPETAAPTHRMATIVDSMVPTTSTINVAPGLTVGNAATVRLRENTTGQFDLMVYASVKGGTVHLIIDVVGYLK